MNYAGFWIRFAAYLIDYIIIMVAQLIIYGVLGVSLFSAASLDPEAGGMFEDAASIIAVTVTSIGSILYYVLMESSAKQGTLGKMALGLVVADENGNRISFLRALGRYFAKILSALILMIGYIMAGFTEKKQGLHDIICSTVVVKGNPGEVGVDANIFS